MFKLSTLSDGAKCFRTFRASYANTDTGLMLKLQGLHVCQMENKKRMFVVFGRSEHVSFKSLVSSWWSSFGVALSAVDWPASVWLEGNFAFLSAVSAGCLVHLFIIHTLFSTPLSDIAQKNTFFAQTPHTTNTVLNLSIKKRQFSCYFMKKEYARNHA